MDYRGKKHVWRTQNSLVRPQHEMRSVKEIGKSIDGEENHLIEKVMRDIHWGCHKSIFT